MVLALGLTLPAPALDKAISSEKRAAAQARKAEVAAEIDVLRASDEELESAVRALDTGVAGQSSITQAAQQAVLAAQSTLSSAEGRLAATEAKRTDLRQRATAVAVEAYVHPGGDSLLQILRAKDLSEAGRRQSLLSAAAANDRDVLEQLRAARQDQQFQQENLAAARKAAEVRRRAAADKLADLEQALADQNRLKSALAGRIAQFSAEVDALSREEAALTAAIRSRQAPAPASAAAKGSGGGMARPAAGSITSSFGIRWGRLHAGVDIANAPGTPIRAARDGTVILAEWNGGYGNTVVIDHGDGLSTLYAHASRLRVADGRRVDRGDLIADMGSTGNSTGSHLHFEVRVNGSPRNPSGYLR